MREKQQSQLDADVIELGNDALDHKSCVNDLRSGQKKINALQNFKHGYTDTNAIAAMRSSESAHNSKHETSFYAAIFMLVCVLLVVMIYAGFVFI